MTTAINEGCIGGLLQNRYLVGGLKFGWGSLMEGFG